MGTKLPLFFSMWMAAAALAQQPRWEDPHLAAAQDYVKQHDLRKAVETLQTVVDIEPACRVDAYLRLAALRQQLGEGQQAAAAYEAGLKAHPDSVELRKRFGHMLIRENPMNPRAGELLAKAVADAPGDAEAHYLYGEWACANNSNELCIREFSAAAALPASGRQAQMQIYTFIGVAEDKLDHADRADAAFRKALDLNTGLASPSPDALFEYVKFLIKESRDDEAQQLIARLLKFAPGFGPAYLERAKYLGRQSQTAKAAEQAELALRYAGDDREQQRAAHIFLAKTYNALGRTADADAHQAWLQSTR